MITIQPQYLALSKLFDGRLFQIPEYQRAYSWTTRQRRDLFEDIQKTHSKGAEEAHFMAAIVCLRRKKQTLGTDEFYVIEIVDGQQRLTTLIILLKAIALALDKNKKIQKKLKLELDELLVKPEGDELLLLQTNHDSSHHFSTYLKKGTSRASIEAKTIADREILRAIEDCQLFVSEWQKKNSDLLGLATLLKNRLYFLLHEIDQEKAVYTVFEVLNSRGLDVSWLDRLKSILMGAAFELPQANNSGVIHDLHVIWRNIYSVIGLRQGLSTEALRFAATLLSSEAPSRPLGEEDSVSILRGHASNAKNIKEVASWLLDVTTACDVVTANTRMNAVTRIAQARLLATAIQLRVDLGPKHQQKLLKIWEKVTFRIYGLLGNDARTRVGEYVRLAWRVHNEKLSFESISDAIKLIGKDFTIEAAIEEMREANCYEGWEVELRYLMFRYEEHLAAAQKLNFKNEQWEKIWMVSPVDSIEHILPQSKAPDKHKHRLGNLVLLPPRLNSKLQDKMPNDKADSYTKTGLLIAGEVVTMMQKQRWTSKTIVQREESILKWVKTEWAD